MFWLVAVVLLIGRVPNAGIFIGLGLVGAFVAGLVGVGGAIIMIPLLVYIPQLLGLEPLSFHHIAGAEMIQVATAGVVGALSHWGEGRVRGELVLSIGLPMMIGALGGAVVSRFLSADLLMGVFAVLALAASAVMLTLRRRLPTTRSGDFLVSRASGMGLGAPIGFLSGMVGAGGGFLLIPGMVFLLRVPMRLAVGSSLGVIALSASAGAVGKAATGQVDWMLALPLVTGALLGARLGASVSHRTHTQLLATILGVLIAVIALRMWWDLLW